jgi:hypothetical protein
LASTGDRFTWTTLGSGIGSGALSSRWQTMAVPAAAVATNLNEPLDIEVNLFPQLTFNPILTVDNLTQAVNLVLGKLFGFGIISDTSLI